MSVVSAALVPAAPVLLRSLGGRMDPGADIRNAALQSVHAMLDTGPERIVVIAEGDHDEEFDESAMLGLHRLGGLPGSFVRDGDGQRMLPIPLAIAASILSEAGWSEPTTLVLVDESIAAEQALQRGRELQTLSERVGILLVGNGSACSTAKAPGSLHPDAETFNQRVLELLTEAAREDIAALTQSECREQLSDIRVPLQIISGAHDRWNADIELAQEFQGVFYVCASIVTRS